jgi:N-acetylglucosamine kinase-like BadF-type ATPase
MNLESRNTKGGIHTMYVLGIDGGGTKTTGMVADENGNVYMQAVTGRSNPNTLSQQEFEQVMSQLIIELKNPRPADLEALTACFAGMAGVGESGREVEVAQLLKKYLPSKTEVIVKNDAVNALYSGTLGAPGIVQIAGTGAIAFGMNEVNKTARSGGWGYLFDDEGSGFYMGNEALRAVFQDFDGRGSATDLTDCVLKHFNVSYVPDIIGQVYGQEHPRSAIAPLSTYVVEAAVADDEVAKDIMLKACESMVSYIYSCHRQLFEENHQTIIVLSGGVFTNAQLFIQLLNELTSETMPNVEFRQTQVSPVGGAVVAGLLSQNLGLGEHFAKQMNEQMQR